MTASLLEARPLTVPFSDIPAIPTKWLWQDFLPYGTPVLLAAPGGTGKGLLIAAIIKRVTTGERWPGEPEGTTREPASCVLVAPEDNANEAVRWRLDAAGADVRFVHDMSVLPDDEPFFWPAAKHKLRKAIQAINRKAAKARELGLPSDHPDYMVPVRFLAIDPLFRVVPGGVNTPEKALRAWVPLEAVCREFSLACVVSTHTNKDEKSVSGSQGLTAASRITFLVSRDEDHPRGPRRYVTVFKANMVSDETATVFEVAGSRLDARAVLLEPDPGELEAPRARARITYADLRRTQPLPPQVRTAELPMASAGQWRVLRRLTRPGCGPEPVFIGASGWATMEEAREAAESDPEARGYPLGWRSDPDSADRHMAVLRRPDGATVSYGVYVAGRTAAAA